MRITTELVSNLNHNIKNLNTNALAKNIQNNEDVVIGCNFFISKLSETPHVTTYIECGDTIINGAIPLKGFETIEIELCDLNFKPHTIHSFKFNQAQSIQQYAEYLKALILHIEQQHSVQFPKELIIIGNKEIVFNLESHLV